MSDTKDAKPKKAAKPKAEHATQASHAARAPSATPAAQPSTSQIIIKGKVISTRGRVFTGKVISNKMTKTITVEWERRKYVPKYQRYEKRRTRVKAHDETNAAVGDMVEIMETRPISKTKKFLVIKRIQQ